MAMRLDGTLGRSQFMGDLLVELAAHDETEHLAFARSKNCNQRLHLLDLVPLAACRRVTRQSALDDAEQLLRFNRFGQEIFGAGLDGSHRGRRVGMSGEEHDRQHGAELVETALQLRAAQAGYPHVEQDAAGLVFVRQSIKQLLRRRIGRDLIAGELQPPLDRGAEGVVIVNDMNAARQSLSYGVRGGRNASAAPAPLSLSPQIWPLW